jgi:ribose 5-phosphate isomerase B
MIFIGADHQGRVAFTKLKDFLEELGLELLEVGKELESAEDDYPDFAKEVCLRVLQNEQSRGILLCGSGQGMVIAANRFKGIRAGLCWNKQEAELARSDDDINILCLPKFLFEDEKWKEIIKTFLETEFKADPKYQRRIEKLDRLP